MTSPTNKSIKTISIEDFSGGRTNFYDQATIQPNMCASGSMNVWYPERGLTQTPGYSLAASFTASGNNSMPMVYVDDAVNTNFQIFYRIQLTSTGNATNNYYLFGSTTTLTDTLALLGYNVGSISISGASLISATGNGTSWTTNVTANDLMIINSLSGGRYAVSSVEDNTHLTLAAPVGSAVPTGTSYTISPGLFYTEIAAASLNGNLCWSTTGDTMNNYSSTGTTRTAAAPQAAFLGVFQNYLFAARSNTAQSRLYWSSVKDPTSWPVNNFIDIDKQRGNITGLFPFGQELIVFKTRGMYKVLGNIFDPSNPQYSVLQINTSQDFIFNSNYSCCVFSRGQSDYYGRAQLIFYANGRIYKYIQGTQYISDISPAIIRDLPNAFGSYTDVQANVDQRVKAIVYNDYYIIKGLADPNNSGSESSACFILDRNGAWWYLSNRNAVSNNGLFGTGSPVVVPSISARPVLISHNITNGKIFTWDFIGPSFGTLYADTDTNGVTTTRAINSTWISKEFNIEYGTFKTLVVYLKKQSTGNITISWSIDQATYVDNTVSMTTGRGNIIRAVLPIQQKGTTIQIKLNHNVANETFKIYAIKIFYEDSPMERLL